MMMAMERMMIVIIFEFLERRLIPRMRKIGFHGYVLEGRLWPFKDGLGRVRTGWVGSG